MKFLILICIVAGILFTMWTRQKSPHPVETFTKNQIDSLPSRSPIIIVVPTQRKSNDPSSDNTHDNTASTPQPIPPLPPYAKKPDGNVIEFSVVNGYAIAYGDVLLGQTEPHFQGNRGLYDAPSPQTWPRAEIPYGINPALPYPHRIEKALDYLRQHTPIKFIPYDNQKDAIYFDTGTEHCYSSLGRVGGVQSIQLAETCQTQAILHEIMHALGFIHEQSRPDRDQYIRVVWQNIEEKYQSQFAMVPDSFFEPERGTPFDYHSIMLYDPSAFAIQPDLPTLIPTYSEQIAPTKEGLSETDLKRVNHLYDLYQ